MRVKAIMPIKLDNERLPGKNTMMLGGKPLLCHELDNLLKIERISEVAVYCSSEEIKEFLPEGIVFKKRSKQLDLPTSNFTQIFESYIQDNDADIYIYAHATAPFIKQETMQECLDAVISGEYDSAFCAVEIQDYLWMNGKPLNFDAQNIPRSQDMEAIYRETSGVYVFTKDVFMKYKRRIGMNPYIKKVNYKEAVDINNHEDFELATALVNIDLK